MGLYANTVSPQFPNQQVFYILLGDLWGSPYCKDIHTRLSPVEVNDPCFSGFGDSMSRAARKHVHRDAIVLLNQSTVGQT